VVYFSCRNSALRSLELSVLLGKLGRQPGFLTVSMPSSPRSLTRAGSLLAQSSPVGCRRRRPASSDVALAAVRHFTTEGSTVLSFSVFWL